MKKTILILVALAVGATVGFQGCVAGLRSEFEERAAKCESMEDFALEPVPDKDNVAAGLAEVVAWLKQHDANRELGRPELIQDASAWTYAKEEDKQHAADYIESVEPVFAKLEEALSRKHFVSATDMSRGANLKIEEIGDVIDLSALLAGVVRMGDVERGCRLMLKLADRCEIPFFMGHSISEHVKIAAALALRTARNIDAKAVRAALDPLLEAAIPATGPNPLPIKQERTFWIEVTRKWGRGESIGEHTDDGDSRAWYRRPALYRDGLKYLDLIDDALKRCNATPTKAYDHALHFLDPDAPAQPLFLATYVRSTLMRHFRHYTDLVTTLRLAREALAILEHRQESGKWPNSPPLGLRDPYGSGKFLFVQLEHEVRLYSAKPDDFEWLIDDGHAWVWPHEH